MARPARQHAEAAQLVDDAFGCEAAFTLLAVPVLGRHGPLGVSVHATWIATVIFAVLGGVREGPAAVTRLSAADWLATGYLAVGVTAVAFVLWYTSVDRLGAGRAGLLTGIADRGDPDRDTARWARAPADGLGGHRRRHRRPDRRPQER